MQLPHALIPSKTFLFGEYAILNKAPAVLLATPPFFEIVSKDFEKFHVKSIAAKMLNAPQWLGVKDFCIKGLGKSSAEALVACVANQNILETSDLIKEYSSACERIGLIASGADFICQWLGFCTTITNDSLETKTWNLPDIDIGIWSTNNELATQQHLSEITSIPREISNKAYDCLDAWNSQKIEQICESVNCYQETLIACKLQSRNTQKLVAQILDIDGIKLAKGCGAMGEDIILTLSETNIRQKLIHKTKSLAIKNIFLNNLVVPGLSYQIEHLTHSLTLSINEK